MKRVFGKKKATAPTPTLEDASKGLGGRVDSIDSKVESLEKELKVYKDKMKNAKSPAVKKNLQKRALEVLKRKRMYEAQRDNVAAQQFNIDQASFGVESAKASVDTVAAMKSASNQLKNTLKKDLDIDAIEDLADDMAELMDDFNDINEALGRNYATPDDIDEADLDAELELLEDELEEEELVSEDATPSYLLPSQPTDVPGSKLPEVPTANTPVQEEVDEYGLPTAAHR